MGTRYTGTPYDNRIVGAELVLHIPRRRKNGGINMSRETVAKWLRDMLPKQCMNCGSGTGLQYHHIVPVICGGNEVPSNIAVLCSDCHSKVHYGRGGIINHGDSIKKGIDKARANGLKMGRKCRTDAETIMRTIAENSTQFNLDSLITESEIMSMIGLKNVQYSKYKRKLFDAMNADVWPYEWEKPIQVRNHPMYERVIKKIRNSTV